MKIRIEFETEADIDHCDLLDWFQLEIARAWSDLTGEDELDEEGEEDLAQTVCISEGGK